MPNLTTLKVALLEPGILKITLFRPEVLNALNATLFNELFATLKEAKENNQVKAILLTGEGKAFCAGADINRLAQLNPLEAEQFALQGQSVFRYLELLGKPSVAAINGYAFGGGCELAMAASIRIASEKAQFGQPEIKLGIIPGYGGTQRLARLVGKGRALDLCLTGRFINAQEALNWGLVTQVLAPEELEQHAMELLTHLCQLAPLACASIIKVIDTGFDLNLNDALQLEAAQFAILCATQDKEEGVAAFLEKREAKFQGR